MAISKANYDFTTGQITIIASIAMTVYLRTNMHHRNLGDGAIYYGALFFGLVVVMFNGLAELSMTIDKINVFFKQRDFKFYPAWAYALPTWVMRIPLSLLESVLWIIITYYTIGFVLHHHRYGLMALEAPLSSSLTIVILNAQI